MDDMEIDPELAAQMGFASFGTAPKKRKLNADEAVTDLSINAKSATGSNSQPLGHPPTKSPPPEPPKLSSHDSATSTSDSTNIGAFARGVRNERGDMAYFLPSFLEDPWVPLGKKAL